MIFVNRSKVIDRRNDLHENLMYMKPPYQATLEAIFKQPASDRIKWFDCHVLFLELGAVVSEAQGSRLGVRLFGGCWVFYHPQASPYMDIRSVQNIRKWLEANGVKP